MIISIIVALTNSNVIGLNNSIPWYLPADLSWFRKHTLNKPVIMGYNTWKSIGRSLPDRKNIILSRNNFCKGNVLLARSVKEAIFLSNQAEEVMIIGGANVYKQFINKVYRMYITYIYANIYGNVYFPDCELKSWSLVFSKFHAADYHNRYDLHWKIFERKSKHNLNKI